MIALGAPGVAAEFSATMGPWAIEAGIPQLAFEPIQSSSYVGGERPIHPIYWIAVQVASGDIWSVTQVQTLGQMETDLNPDGVSALAREVIHDIGTAPVFLWDGRPDISDTISTEWDVYARSIIEPS
jgi:hypothetical protein